MTACTSYPVLCNLHDMHSQRKVTTIQFHARSSNTNQVHRIPSHFRAPTDMTIDKDLQYIYIQTDQQTFIAYVNNNNLE